MRRFTFAGGTAVVTGAASGIGEALSHALARRGCHLVLLDRDQPRLAAVADAIRGGHPAVAVRAHPVDLADAEATLRVAGAVLAEHPRIRLLVNNAGVALDGRFDQVALEEFDWVVDVNLKAAVRLTHTLLPALKAEPGSHLVNISSVFGLIAPAGQVAYATSKFAVRGFTEALRHELFDHRIGVTVVHPGGVRTRIGLSARVGRGVSAEEAKAARELSARLLRMDPRQAAGIIVAGIERRRPRVLVGWSARVPDLVVRLLPGSYGTVMRAVLQRLSKTAPAAPATATPPSPDASTAGS
ncbi:MAG TPA: SDR family NAD(P)-dependent oxidoreductase [Micromonosporaceae bacterium]|nr:SDR family NAD(P)-dependent oxidoreductase [Micromonosporaceae bacterium]